MFVANWITDRCKAWQSWLWRYNYRARLHNKKLVYIPNMWHEKHSYRAVELSLLPDQCRWVCHLHPQRSALLVTRLTPPKSALNSRTMTAPVENWSCLRCNHPWGKELLGRLASVPVPRNVDQWRSHLLDLWIWGNKYSRKRLMHARVVATTAAY